LLDEGASSDIANKSHKTAVQVAKEAHKEECVAVFLDVLPYKVCLIGDSGVGKSCLVLRFADDSYTESYISTIGVDFKTKSFSVDATSVKMEVYDTSGQERFRADIAAYYAQAHAFLVCYDVCDNESFQNVRLWLSEIERYTSSSPNVAVIIVACKMDSSKRTVSFDEGKAFASSKSIGFFETSAKENLFVEQVFIEVANAIKSKRGGGAHAAAAVAPPPPPSPAAQASNGCEGFPGCTNSFPCSYCLETGNFDSNDISGWSR